MTAFDRFADWVADRWSSGPWFALCVAGVVSWLAVLVRVGLNDEVVHLWLNSPTTALTFLGMFLLHHTTTRFERRVEARLLAILAELGIDDPCVAETPDHVKEAAPDA